MPGTGNLQSWHPVPVVVPQDSKAVDVLVDARHEAETEYERAESANDAVGTTVWGRVSEQIRKLSLIYAISENHLAPIIHEAAANWATRFTMHQARRMLFMAENHVAENPYHADCLRLIRKLQDTADQQLPHSIQEMIATLEQQGDLVTTITATNGRPQRTYRLVRCPPKATPHY
jgi:hypothetical protein